MIRATVFASVLALASLAGCGTDQTDDGATLVALSDQVDEVQLRAAERDVAATATALQDLRSSVEQALAEGRLSEGRAAEIVTAAASVEAALTSITTTTTTTTAPPTTTTTTTTTTSPSSDDGDDDDGEDGEDGDDGDGRKPPKPEDPSRGEPPGTGNDGDD
ncbi:hypothetical protein BH20ACT2_BH20ACT2_24220 [soil metagenome]